MSQAETIVGLGTRGDYVAVVPNADPTRLRLTPEEGRIFGCVGRIAKIEDVLAMSGMDEPKAIALLLALRAKGAIVPARFRPSAPQTVDAAMSEEVDLDPDRKREILELDRSLESMNHYEVLGLTPEATAEEVQKAYFEASRRFHPDRYFQKNLGSFRARIERIFRRATEAKGVLCDPARRAEYLKAHPELAPFHPSASAPSRPSAPPDPEREAERRARLAKHPYLAKSARITELLTRAKAHLGKGDFGMACTDLHVASQIDPKNVEIQHLLTDARRKQELTRSEEQLKKAREAEQMGDGVAAANAYKLAANIDAKNAQAALKAAALMFKLGQDLKEAKVLAQRACELEPQNARAHLVLGQILFEGDLKKLAKKHFEDALKLDPDNADAKAQLKKLRWTF